MGFNIGVSSEQRVDNQDCDNFIDRRFYNFINDGKQYGDESILMKSGQYYGLDLSPLMKLVYTWDEVTKDYLEQNIQNIDTLLSLITLFRNEIHKDNSVCDNLKYIWYDQPIGLTQEDIETLVKTMGEEMARPFLDNIEKQEKEIKDNPNPWKWYFEDKKIIEDLDNLISSLKCYKNNGVTKVYLTAG